MDPFHVVQWASDALDEVRKEEWRRLSSEVKEMERSSRLKRGRPRGDDADAATLLAARRRASEVKGSAFATQKAPENLTEKQSAILASIRSNNSRYYRAYDLKEKLRMILKLGNVEDARTALKSWYWRASHSRIASFKQLAAKIKRNMPYILNTIKFSLGNARIEAMNNRIKLVIRTSYGFRHVKSLIDMIYLVCSNIEIPLPNRGFLYDKAS